MKYNTNYENNYVLLYLYNVHTLLNNMMFTKLDSMKFDEKKINTCECKEQNFSSTLNL